MSNATTPEYMPAYHFLMIKVLGQPSINLPSFTSYI